MNRTNIMTTAWSLFRAHRDYHLTFAQALTMAWRAARGEVHVALLSIAGSSLRREIISAPNWVGCNEARIARTFAAARQGERVIGDAMVRIRA